MNYNEYFKLILIAKLKQNKYDVDAVARILHMKKREVIRYMELFSLPERRGKRSKDVS